MMFVMILLNLFLAVLSWTLARRVRSGVSTAQTAFETQAETLLKKALRRHVEAALDRALIERGDADGLGAMEVAFREFNDPYQTVSELLTMIGSGTEHDLQQLIKQVYQLFSGLDLMPDQAVQTVVSLGYQNRLNGGRIGFIQAGERLDPSRMIYLNNGSEVRQPLGVVVFDAAGKVTTRAKVYCQ